MKNTQVVEIECSDCNGSGVYRGQGWPEKTGAVCEQCAGSGKRKLSYVPFTGRTVVDGLEVVGRLRGKYIHSGFTATVTYEDFKNGKLP